MKPPFNITTKILNLSVEISLIIGELQLEMERNLHLRRENRLRSIQSSLAIENNSLTLEQVTAIIEGKRVLGKPQEIQEVKNAFAAYEMILSYNPYSTEDFLKAHQLMTDTLIEHAGEFRQKDVGIFDTKGNVVHMGARPRFVQSLFQELFEWAKDSDVSDLIKSCVVHYEIEMIHPFADGNGRIGRLWKSVILSKWNSLFAWLPIETIVYENQQGYYHALAESDKQNDSTVFIEFMLSIIHQTLQQYMPNKMSDKMSDKENEAFMIISAFLSTHEFVTNRDAVKLLDKSEATVRRYFSKFVSIGLLESVGVRKERKYRFMKNER